VEHRPKRGLSSSHRLRGPDVGEAPPEKNKEALPKKGFQRGPWRVAKPRKNEPGKRRGAG